MHPRRDSVIAMIVDQRNRLVSKLDVINYHACDAAPPHRRCPFA